MAEETGREKKGAGWILGIFLAAIIPAVLVVFFWRTTPVVGGWSAQGDPAGAAGPSAPGAPASPAGQASLAPEEVYRGHCARCHGANLEGTGAMPALKRPGWPYGKNRALLVKIIHQGRGLTMPGYEGKLSNRQIEALADWLQAANAASAP